MKKVVLLAVLVSLSSLAWPYKDGTNRGRTVAITHVTIVDPRSGSSRRDMTVVVSGRTITSVGTTDKVHIPSGAFRFNGSGKFLIPGLWDMHVHVLTPERDFPMFIANGVLGVRNMAGVAKDVFKWRADVASGRVLGPRMVACGPLVDGPERLIRSMLSRFETQRKVVGQFSP